MELALICLVAAVVVFIVGRRWAIAVVVGVVTVVWMTLNQGHYSFRLENGGAGYPLALGPGSCCSTSSSARFL